jgi:hypothetical protein
LAVRAAFHADDAARIVAHADDVVDVVRAADSLEDLAQAANQADNLADAARTGTSAPTDLYAFGNQAGPRPPRAGGDIVPNASGMVGPEYPPLPNGASTFSDPNVAPLTGHYHKLPGGTQLPDGLRVIPDGIDVNPASFHPPTHHTIYPSQQMPFDDFVTLFKNLPWQYVGKK